MNTSNHEEEKSEETQQPSTSTSPQIFTKSRQNGVSEFYTTSYAKLTKDNIELMKVNNNPQKKYYFFDENEKLQVYQVVKSSVIESLNEMKLNFTLEEGLLVFLAAERFNDPMMAKLYGRTDDECIQIFTSIVNNPEVFGALQDAFRKMNPGQIHKLMCSLPFTEQEDSIIKRLDSTQPPTKNYLHNLQKESFTHFRGRRAMALRYSQLWTNKELDNQKCDRMPSLTENTILPFHDKFSAATLKYLTACSTPELNETLNFAENVAAVSHLCHSSLNSSESDIFGKLILNEQVYDIHNDKIFVYIASGKLYFQPALGREVSYCSHICVKISDAKITFMNAFGIAILVNGVTCLSGQKVVFPHKGTFVIAVPNFEVFSYTADTNYVCKTLNSLKNIPQSPDVPDKVQPDFIEQNIDIKDSNITDISTEENGIKNEQMESVIVPEKPIKVERREIIEALRLFQHPSDEYDLIPIPFDLRRKARMRDIEGLPTKFPLDENLLPEYVLYKYLTFINPTKSEIPCDYLAFQQYLNDEMSEKLKLSKFIKPDSFNLAMIPMSESVSGADQYNVQLQSLLQPTHVPPAKYESDIRFYSNVHHVIEVEEIQYFGQLRTKVPPPPSIQPTKIKKPRIESNIEYNDFKCELKILNSYTPGVPKYYPYFPPKPRLVRNELGHPVWINLPEKPKPKTAKRNFVSQG